MPSTTATTLASNRRRLRLAQHTRALSPSPSPEPIDMSSVASSSSKKNKKSSNNSSSSPAPSPTLTLDLSNSNSPDNTSNTSFNSGGGQHKQKQKQSISRSSQHSASSSSQQQSQQQHNSTASSNNNSRGRSRRSRAATRRSATDITKSVSSKDDDPTMSMHTTTHMSRQQEILAGLEDVETAARDSSISRVSQQQIIVNDNNNMSQQHNNNNNFEDERLNLHVTDSIDSDDNGTCFNSIGTTTPRQQVAAPPQPQPPTSQATNKRIENNVYQPNLEDEDNNKTSDKVIFSSVNNIEVAQSNRTYHALDNERGKNISQRKRSTHKIDTTSATTSGNNTKNLSPLHENAPQSNKQQSSSIEQRHLERTLHNRNQVRKGSIWDHPEDMVSNNINNNKKDDNSTAYAEFEQDGNSYSRRPHRGGTTRRGAGGGGGSIESSKYDMDEKMLMENAMGLANQNNEGGEGDNVDGVLLSGQNMKTALGVGAAATLGAFVLGPVGLLVGAASVGIGMGVLQIPEEQRTNVKNHAATSFEKAKHIACNLNESMATGCAKYSGTDPSEVATVVGKVVPEEIMDTCGCYGGSTNGDGEDREKSNRYQQHGGDDGGQSLTGTDLDIRSQGSSPIANAVNGVERGMNRLVGDVFGDEQQQSPVSQSMNVVSGGGGLGDTKGRGLDGVGGQANENEDAVGRRVACGRKGRVVPLSQIHSLRPSLQPRAWLDVMASAYTSRDDKNEAMQEILILAKDKEISRWLLEEGILDSLMYILSNYFRNYSSFLRNETPIVMENEKEEPFKSYKKGGNAFYHAKLASNCCVALGKAYCASVHTEGDLLLMSAYSRGSVPVERQLAQMLFEVPHHMRVINTASNGVGNAPSEAQVQHDVEFTLTELSMQQAEDLASSIKSLDDGKIDV